MFTLMFSEWFVPSLCEVKQWSPQWSVIPLVPLWVAVWGWVYWLLALRVMTACTKVLTFLCDIKIVVAIIGDYLLLERLVNKFLFVQVTKDVWVVPGRVITIALWVVGLWRGEVLTALEQLLLRVVFVQTEVKIEVAVYVEPLPRIDHCQFDKVSVEGYFSLLRWSLLNFLPHWVSAGRVGLALRSWLNIFPAKIKNIFLLTARLSEEGSFAVSSTACFGISFNGEVLRTLALTSQVRIRGFIIILRTIIKYNSALEIISLFTLLLTRAVPSVAQCTAAWCTVR